MCKKLVYYYFYKDIYDNYKILSENGNISNSVYYAPLYNNINKDKIEGLYTENYVSIQSPDNENFYYDTSQGSITFGNNSLIFTYSELWKPGNKNYKVKIISGTGKYLNAKGYIYFNDGDFNVKSYASIKICLC